MQAMEVTVAFAGAASVRRSGLWSSSGPQNLTCSYDIRESLIRLRDDGLRAKLFLKWVFGAAEAMR
jgi:hypothetical protein